ncbi:MAG TPA: VOC family protein, partial [Microbacteriaceae bacterium]|nr:VOC family protein [Microbacteriaceae bacterium]
MSTRDDYPAGVPCWVDTNQPDPAAAARFYSALFGWEAEDTMPPGSGGHYFMARLTGRVVAAISSQPPESPARAVWNTYVRVESADDTAVRVRAAGGTVISQPFDVFEAGRMAVFHDPQGAVFSVWQPSLHRGAAAVNENGALVFNTLHTDDPDAAAGFYGTVFGWERIGDGPSWWALAGYGDYLEESNPGLRAMLRQSGAPDRFEDVVAALEPRGTGPARWIVTFAVDDADAAAAHAAKLGGAVITPPQKVPWQRVARLADPAGATFQI